MRALLIDLDGVLYRGDTLIPGAAEAVRWIVGQKIPHLFLTNTTSRPRVALVGKLRGFGIETTDECILSPPVAASAWLEKNAPGPAALFVPEATKCEFDGLVRLDDQRSKGASSVVIGDLGKAWDFDKLNRAFRLLMENENAPLVALGMTRYWRAPDGLRLDVAPFCRALEHATGRTAIVLGKPAEPFFQTALDMIGANAGETVMIGDDIVGDIEGAQRGGIRGLLVRTGKFRPQDLEGSIRPDGVVDSIADLAEWWSRHHKEG